MSLRLAGMVGVRGWMFAVIIVSMLVGAACSGTGTVNGGSDTAGSDVAVDGALDGGETGIDTGVDGQSDVSVEDAAPDMSPDTSFPPDADCVRDEQCASGICEDGSCVAGTCDDDVKNQDETDVDCGGEACEPCSVDKSCRSAADCEASLCLGGTCAEPSCSDGLKNQDETDVDCGGSACGGCSMGGRCVEGSDCQSGVCLNGLCSAPSCRDGVMNNEETDVDCGGPNCPPCADGASCEEDDDCQNICTSNDQCQVCENGGTRKVSGNACGYQDRGTTEITQTCSGNTWTDTSSTCQGVYFRSCAEIDDAQMTPSNGTYTLDPDGPGSGSNNIAPFQAYCQMTYDGNRTGGWTLVLKVDGDTGEFYYDDPKWTNSSLYNSSSLQPFNGTEAKLESYLHVGFTDVHFVMETPTGNGSNTVQNSLTLYGQADSMQSLMSIGQQVTTYAGRSAWLGLMPDPAIQDNCNLEGFNVTTPSWAADASVRIGLLGNNEFSCASVDSFLGVGPSNNGNLPQITAGSGDAFSGNGVESATAIIFVE